MVLMVLLMMIMIILCMEVLIVKLTVIGRYDLSKKE